MGRKSTYDPKVAASIIAQLKTGTPLAQICLQPGMPIDDTVRNWGHADQAFGREIARAREVGWDAIAGNTRLIAQGVEGHSSGDVQRDKLMVDTDLKLLAKWDPKRYGEKVTTELTGADGKDLSLSDHEAAAKLAAILEAVKARQ